MGNAVPPLLAFQVANSIKHYLLNATDCEELELKNAYSSIESHRNLKSPIYLHLYKFQLLRHKYYVLKRQKPFPTNRERLMNLY